LNQLSIAKPSEALADNLPGVFSLRHARPDPARKTGGSGLALSEDDNQRLLGIVTQSLQVRRHYELFQVVQGDVQHFIPHDLLISAWGDFGGPTLKLDVISALPGVRTAKLGHCGLDELLQKQYVRWLAGGRRPVLLHAGDSDWPLPFASCTCALHRALAGMQSLLLHGVSDLRDNQDSLYVLASSRQIFRAATGVERFRFLVETVVGQIDSAYRRVAAMKRRGRVSPRAYALDRALGRHELSAREVEVLRGAAEGLGNVEIARQLTISPHTIKNHMKRIMRKLGVANRTAAAAKYRG